MPAHQTYKQHVRKIAKRLRNPKIMFTQEDRCMLANMLERLLHHVDIAEESDVVVNYRYGPKTVTRF
jgi:hypothetical protein